MEEDRTPYSHHNGEPDVLEAVCEKLNRVNKIPARPEDVLMIPGTMFSIFLACYYSLAPGDEALICPAPVYPPFMTNIKNAGGVPVYNPLIFSESGCRLDLEDLKSRITAKTRLLMICNPHNPCGLVLTRDDLEGIGRLAAEHDLLIFSDELYEDMVFEGEHISLASLSKDLFERTLTVFGFSKAFGIPAYRSAYLVNRGEHMSKISDRVHNMIVHTDTLAQAAAKAALLHGRDWLTSLNRHLAVMRDYLMQRLSAMPGIWCPRPSATPFVFPNISAYKMSGREMTDYLLQEGRIAVQGGEDYGPHGQGHIRINLATSRPVLEEAMDRMEKALKKLG